MCAQDEYEESVECVGSCSFLRTDRTCCCYNEVTYCMECRAKKCNDDGNTNPDCSICAKALALMQAGGDEASKSGTSPKGKGGKNVKEWQLPQDLPLNEEQQHLQGFFQNFPSAQPKRNNKCAKAPAPVHAGVDEKSESVSKGEGGKNNNQQQLSNEQQVIKDFSGTFEVQH